MGNVKIDYSIDNGSSWVAIVASTLNDGSYDWTVPDTPSEGCLIRVSETDGDPFDISDTIFSIVDELEPGITVTSPNGGETLNAGSIHEITWTFTGTIDNVLIEYSIDSGASWTTIVTSTANNGSFNWIVPGILSDNCLVKISMDDEDKNPFDISDALFSIVSSSSETVTVTSPNGGEGLLIGSIHEITWTTTGTINSVMIEYSTNNGSTWKNIIKSTGNDGIYEWEVPDDPSDNCLVRISGNDLDVTPSDVSDAPFFIVSETSSCGDIWSGANYAGSDTFRCVTYGSSKFVAVGNNGAIKTSSNGITWTTRTSSITGNLYGVIYENAASMFAAVGAEGVILTSSDGITWETQDAGITNDLRGVAYGTNTFVAVGDSGVILTSPDGITWDVQLSGITSDLYGVVYGYEDNTFAAVGDSGIILTSQYGTTWAPQSSGTSNNLQGITYGGDIFLAVGASGAILTSSNGMSWNSRTSSVTTDFMSAAYGSDTYVVVGDNGKIVTSSDCVYWDSQSSGVRGNLSGVVFGNSRFVAVGGGEIIYSMCDQAGAANSLNNQKFLWGPGGTRRVFSKRAPGRRRQEINENIDVKASLNLVSPNGDETLQAGVHFLITWESEKYIENIKLEYSPDNGSTYLTIKDRIPNTGYYEWQVPHHISSNCLVRVSNTDGVKPEQNILLYDLKFKINSLTHSPISRKDFILWLGDKNNMNPSIPEISILQEPNGKEYICFEENIKEIGRSKEFHNRWHSLKVLMDQINYKITIFLDGQPAFENL